MLERSLAALVLFFIVISPGCYESLARVGGQLLHDKNMWASHSAVYVLAIRDIFTVTTDVFNIY